jgi:hypothetical protein
MGRGEEPHAEEDGEESDGQSMPEMHAIECA